MAAPPPGPPPLSSTVGIWLICAFVQAVLQGMGMLQAYFVWYPRDPWSVKGTVIVLVLLQCIQLAGAIANIYAWFVDGFGSFDELNTIHMQDMLQLTALWLSIFVAQTHFARAIYQLMKRNLILPLFIFVFALTALGAGLGQVILAIGLKHYSNLEHTKVTSNMQAAFALAADVLITVGLTNRVLNFLIMTAINRGVFTMIFAVINIALFLTTPGTFYFMIGILISDKLYMNSLLAILNTREYASHLRGGMEVSDGSSRPPLSFAARTGGTGTAQSGGLSMITVTDTQRGDDLDMKDFSGNKHIDF
ncbi:hypothetical protein C8F01DRAFT_1371045 [Mycena amicta]|nr:hypothetical protein C8F01DRAFT_1371045 [Mycena amicta]